MSAFFIPGGIPWAYFAHMWPILFVLRWLFQEYKFLKTKKNTTQFKTLGPMFLDYLSDCVSFVRWWSLLTLTHLLVLFWSGLPIVLLPTSWQEPVHLGVIVVNILEICQYPIVLNLVSGKKKFKKNPLENETFPIIFHLNNYLTYIQDKFNYFSLISIIFEISLAIDPIDSWLDQLELFDEVILLILQCHGIIVL